MPATKRFGSDVIVGVSINNTTGITGKAYELSDLLRAGIEAEAMGFDAVWVHDAPLGRRTTAAYDPVNVLSLIAGATRHVGLATGILTPQLRNPVMLAQQWATLFEGSEGRAILGVGTGAGTGTLVRREFEALSALRHDSNLDPQRLYEARSKLFDETMDIMRRLWSEDKFSYHGELFKFSEVTLGGARPSVMPPVLIAAGIYFSKEPGAPLHHGWQEKYAGKHIFGPYKRIVDYGDGWFGVHVPPTEYIEKWERVKKYAAEKGRTQNLVKAFNCFVNVDDDPQKAWQSVKDQLSDFHGPPVGDDMVDRWAVSGTPTDVAQKLQGYIDVGVSVFQLVIGSPDQFGQMKRLAEQVLPLLRR
ncbi:MAG: LLM class flavin-dependent oxidoreductase [Pseudorhodoplanes sp.]|uniref:LLM class flavin-dependent oxidoreductase n=1 Tax=Pseudorhodoplanes sp. TaxID=1934341 RepID=UPI003D0E22B6